MKNIIIYFLIFLSTWLFAQTDSLAVDIAADTVIITNYGANENCCSDFKFNVQLENDTILYITEIDTGDICRCANCNFDLQVKITDLAAGDYIAKIYRDWERFDRPTVFIGEIRFSFNPSHISQMSLGFIATQGPCYHIIDNLEKKVLAEEIRLFNAYPNPFNPKTIINYQLPMNNVVELSIYNILGQRIATLVDEKQAAGQYQVEWDASRFNSGVYFYRITTSSGFSRTHKIVLVK